MTSNVSFRITTRRATELDAAALARFATSAFRDTYEADNTPEDMATYIAQSFSDACQRAEIANPQVVMLLAEHAGEIVGYAMLRDTPAPDPIASVDCIEIARLYAAKHLIGAGVGATLMQRALDEAAARGKDTIWLGVWEHNARAIAFYRRWRFADVGTLEFTLGGDRQTDRLMVRRVSGEN